MLRSSCLSALMALVLAWPARADVIVTIGNATVSQGGSGAVDVLIRGTGMEPLNAAGFQFVITTGGPTRLEFVDPQPQDQPATQMSSYLAASNYVFFGDSFSLINGVAVGAADSTLGVGGPLDRYTGSDATDSGADVGLTGADRVLVRLTVTAATLVPPVVGDTFSISLVTSNPANTFFLSSGGSNTLQTPVAAGTVTIGPAQDGGAGVPEPGTWMLVGGACLGVIAWRLRRGNGSSAGGPRSDQGGPPAKYLFVGNSGHGTRGVLAQHSGV